MKTASRSLVARLLFFSLMGSFQHNIAYSKVFEGERLSEPLKIELDFEKAKSDYAVVRVSQESADYVIELHDKSSGDIKKQVDVSAYYVLDEVILVESGDCRRCELVIYGKDAIHQNSPYFIDVNYVHTEVVAEPIDNAALEVLRNITSAGESSYKPPESDPASRKARLQAAATILKLSLIHI